MNSALPHNAIRQEEKEVNDFLAAAEAANKCSGTESNQFNFINRNSKELKKTITRPGV